MTCLSSFLVRYSMEIYRTLYVFKTCHTWSNYLHFLYYCQHCSKSRGILSTMLHAEYKDPRDQIFGIYSIERASLTNGILEDFKPNYSITPRVLFLNVTSRLLQQEPDFIFNRAGIGYQTRNLQLPSWVPDWSEKRDDENVVAVKHESGILKDFRYWAGGSRSLSYEIHQGEILQLHGIILGCVSDVSNKPFPSATIFKGPTDSGWGEYSLRSLGDFG